MSHVELNELIDATFYQSSPAAWQLAKDVAKGHAPYESVALSVDLSSFHLPSVATISVVVKLEIGDAVGIPPNEFAFTLQAQRDGTLFPHFKGDMRILDDGGTRSWIFMGGDYSVPLGPLGQIMDKTILKGIAQQSLGTFLHWFVTETRERIARGDYRTAAELMHEFDG